MALALEAGVEEAPSMSRRPQFRSRVVAVGEPLPRRPLPSRWSRCSGMRPAPSGVRRTRRSSRTTRCRYYS